MTEDVSSIQFNLRNIWNIIEHLPSSFEEEHKKLKAARDRLEQTPKVYGRGLSIKVKE